MYHVRLFRPEQIPIKIPIQALLQNSMYQPSCILIVRRTRIYCARIIAVSVKSLLLFIHTILFVQPRSVRHGRIRPRLGSRCRQERGVIQPPIRHDRSEPAPKMSI